MGNCASNPKTNDGKAPMPEPAPAVTEEVHVEQQENKDSEEKSLGNLLNENVEEKAVAEQGEAKKEEEKPKVEEVKAEAPKELEEEEEEKPKTEEAKPETIVAKAEN